MAEVTLNLGGETFVLKCTLDAFRTIPAALGGFVQRRIWTAALQKSEMAFITG